MISLIPAETLDRLRRAFGSRVDALAPAELQALATADVEGSVSNVRLQELLTDHPVDITRMLTRLCEQGLLVSDSRRRWTTYRLGAGPRGPSLFDGGDSGHLPDDSGHLPDDSGHLPDDVLSSLRDMAKPVAGSGKAMENTSCHYLNLAGDAIGPQRLAGLLDGPGGLHKRSHTTREEADYSAADAHRPDQAIHAGRQPELQFDANQSFQLDAVAAMTDLFDGQPQGAPEYAVINLGAMEGLFTGQQQTELGAGNQLLVAEDKLRANARAIQTRHRGARPGGGAEAWELFDGPANQTRSCPHFSVEMETGTGKTYVYLRTVFELSRRYGFQKFIIVVPSVAIREGVLKNIEITAEHFRALYNNLPFEHFVYDARKVNRLRQFATSNTLQILVINIDAFRKNFTGTEEERKSNVIYKESDKLSGRQPIEFVQAARPIVIIDEPQSVDSTDKAQEAIKALNPLCTLRYSATHRNPYNLVYRLDRAAFELAGETDRGGEPVADGAANETLSGRSVDYKKASRPGPIHMQTQGAKEIGPVTRADLALE
jgi:hypothetical protein